MPNKDLMQLIASGSDTQLYWDYSDTQHFYLYTKSAKALTALSDDNAKTLFQEGAFSWTLPGSNFFGVSAQNNLGNWYPQLLAPQD